MSDSFVNIPDGGGVLIVATSADLPLVGNTQGELAVTADTGNLYEWNGTMWVLIASPSGVGPSFGVIQVPSGTNPVAHVATDTLTFTSSDSNITITGNSSTDTVNFTFTKVPGAANGLATLDGTGKVPLSEIPASLIGAVTYQGTWNANTNTPTLTSSTGTKGFYYLVSVAGNTNLDGHTGWIVGDWAVFDGNVWEQLQGGGAYITSLTGDVTGTGPGATATTIASIQGTTVSGTTGTGNVVFNTSPTIASPTLTGTATIASANFSGTVTFTNPPTISSFTQGSVIFAGASGLLSQDNSKFFWNDTNDQLLLSNGTATNPSYSFSSGTNYGMYFSAGQLDFTTAGIQALFIDSSQNTNIPFASKIHFVNTGGLATLYDWGTSTEGGSVSVNTTGGLSSTYTINIKDPGAGGAGQADFYNINLNSNNILQLARNDAGTDTYLLLAAELLFSTDNTQDLGGDSNGTFLYRPRHVFVGTDIGIGTSGLNNAAVQLQMVSTTKGFLQPVMTTTQKNAISSPPEGLEVYDATLHLPYFWNGSAWTTFGSGTVTSVSVVSANGFAGTVATATTTPAITISTTITGLISGNGTAISAATLTSGDIYVGNGSNVPTGVALSGDATLANTGALTLATVNSNVGTFGSSTSIPTFTVNAKGLITAASGNVVIAPAGTLTGTTLASNVVTSSLTTVGTITTGVWNGTAINVAHGGTGLTTLTAGDVLIGNGTGNVSLVSPGSSGNVLTSNGTTFVSGPVPTIFTDFVFKPGYSGSLPNVFSSWSALYAQLILTGGNRSIEFDDTNGTQTITIPAGTYDMTGVTFTSTPDTPTINLANGVVFTGAFPNLNGDLTVNSLSSSFVFTAPATGNTFITLDNLANLQSSGTSAVIDIPSGGTLALLLNTNSSISLANFEVIQIENGGTLLVLGGSGSILANDTIRGGASGVAELITNATSSLLSPSQVNFAGFILTQLNTEAAFLGYGDSDNITASNVQDALDAGFSGQGTYEDFIPTNGGSDFINDGYKFINLNPAGTIATYTLHMPVTPFDGQELIISSTATISSLTLSPAAGQTFYSGAAVTTMLANGFARYLWDNTVTKWRRVG